MLLAPDLAFNRTVKGCPWPDRQIMHTHYDNLKVTRNAPAEVIRAAYKALGQRYHPDRNASPDAPRIMRLINEAYAVLGDPERRSAYDRELDAAPAGAANPGATYDAEVRIEPEWGMSSRDDASHTPSAAISPSASPLARFFARTFDAWWLVTLLSSLATYYLSRNSPEFVRWSNVPSSGMLFGLLCLPVAMIFDAAIYGVFGNTPGKAILGLKVTGLDGRRLTCTEYARRNLSVWVRGWGLGIPFVSLVTMFVQYRTLRREKQTWYDAESGFRMNATKAGGVRKGVFGIVFVMIACIGLILNAGRDERGRQIQANLAQSAYTWTNPATTASAKIDGIWKLSVTHAEDGQPLYTFTEASGHAAIVFAREVIPDAGMNTYVPAYVKHNAAKTPFMAPGVREKVDGHDSWSAEGHLATNADVRTRVEVRQIGFSFWRVVTVQALPYTYTNDAAATLRQQLWGTVAGQ
ncbi:Chaperone protein DnaJ [Paraburkholderia saeva]|nr:Chaperone protein DnaJ [Paraburkholderia saeva]